MSLPLACVVTSIQQPTPSVLRLRDILERIGCPLILIGDRKGPARFEERGITLYTIEDQLKLPFSILRPLPERNYARKNLGYLLAIQQGAKCIYETDDDNHPLESWRIRQLSVEAQKVAPRPWANVYRMFTDQNIWPRGFPLERVSDSATWAHDPSAPLARVDCPIQQGLADLAPDVDAIWRLVMPREFHFGRGPSVWLSPGTWCPFNSQTTWWWLACYPLMYLPSTCTMRMTDIWRSLVAQRCLWELGHGLVFHAAEVIQPRNEHNLLRDFTDEIAGYRFNGAIAAKLEGLRLESGPSAVGENLIRCYEALVEMECLRAEEMGLLQAWLADIARVLG